MSKLFKTVIAVLVLVAIVSTTAGALPSFTEGEIYVKRTDDTTEVFNSYDKNVVNDQEAQKILDNADPAELANKVPGFPSTSKNSVTVCGDSFGACNENGNTQFQITCDKIVNGSKVGAVVYANGSFQFVDAESVDAGSHTAYFNVPNCGAFIVVVYKPSSTVSSGSSSAVTVVDTATK